MKNNLQDWQRTNVTISIFVTMVPTLGSSAMDGQESLGKNSICTAKLTAFNPAKMKKFWCQL